VALWQLIILQSIIILAKVSNLRKDYDPKTISLIVLLSQITIFNIHYPILCY